MTLKKIFSVMICVIAVTAFGVTAFGTLDVSKKSSLKIQYKYEETAVSGAEFKLYRAAVVSEEGNYSPTDEFKDIPVDYYGINEDGGYKFASTLEGYIIVDDISPTVTGKTGSDGVLRFNGLETGLYVVIGEDCVKGKYTYKAEPFVVCLPAKIDGEWKYDVTALPKSDREEEPGEPKPEPKTTDVKVLKIWDDEYADDDDNGDSRRTVKEIEVELVGKGQSGQSVVLNADNNWRYTWEGLDADVDWKVIEKNVPGGYTVSITKQGITFTVTNTGSSEGSDTTEVTTESTTEEKSETTTKDSSEVTTGGGGSHEDNETTTKEPQGEVTTDSVSETTTKSTSHGGGGGHSHKPTTTPVEEQSEESTEETTGVITEDATSETATEGSNEVETNVDHNDNDGSDQQDTPWDILGGEDNLYDDSDGHPDSDKPDGYISRPEGESPGTADNSPTLPQTGQLWWPVPVLAICGMFLFVFGFIKQGRSDS